MIVWKTLASGLIHQNGHFFRREAFVERAVAFTLALAADGTRSRSTTSSSTKNSEYRRTKQGKTCSPESFLKTSARKVKFLSILKKRTCIKFSILKKHSFMISASKFQKDGFD